MQSCKLIKSPCQESEEPNEAPLRSRAGIPGQHFFIEIFQYAVRNTKNFVGFSNQFLIDTGATCSFIMCDSFRKNKKLQPLIVLPHEKSPLAAHGEAMRMKGVITNQSAFEVESIFVIEHMVYVSDSSETRLNILGTDIIANLVIFYCDRPNASFSGLPRQTC